MVGKLLEALKKKRLASGTEKFKNAHPATLSHFLLDHTPLKRLKLKKPTIYSIQKPEFVERLPWQTIKIFSLSLGIILVFVLGLKILSKRPQKIPTISESPSNSLYMYETGNEDYTAKIGNKQSTSPFISFESRKGSIATFSMVGSQSTTAEQKDNSVVYSNVLPDTDVKYSSVLKGIKEEIVIHRATTSAEFIFNLKTEAHPRLIGGDFYSPYFFNSNNEYQFHFEKPFAVDARGSRTEEIAFTIRKSKDKTDEYQLRISMASEWLTAPNRVYPITIDPTIIYDTSAEFATGILNRSFDTGSGNTPSIETYYQPTTADPYTIGLWHMDEASGNILDSSGLGHTGVPTGTTVVPGRLGNARYFDGTDDLITITNTAALNPRNFTIEAWINPTTISTTQYNEIFTFNQSGVQIRIEPTENKLRLWTLNGTWVPNIGNSIIQSGTWTHIAAVKDGTNVYLYINGKLDATGFVALDTDVAVGGSAAMIGDYPSGSHRFNGIIDEIRLSNIARTPEEIKASASRRPYSTYTSEVIDLTMVAGWNPLTWIERGVTTGDGETSKDSTSLIAQWNFNGTSGITSTNNAGSCSTTCDGTLTNFTNTTGQDVIPNSGWTSTNKRWGTGALMFDGIDDHVVVADNNNLTFGSGGTDTPFSISTWVFPDTLATGADGNWIISKRDAGVNDEYQLIFYGGKIFLAVLSSNGNTISVSTTKTWTPGTWYNIVGTYDGSKVHAGLKIYVNGNLEAVSNGTAGTYTGMNNGTSPLLIGKAGWTTDLNFDGIIDSSAIYNRVLTPAEILSNYTAANVDLQVRVGTDTSPDDGDWEEWRPVTNETQMESTDDRSGWSVNSNDPENQNLSVNISPDTGTGDGADGACSITGTSVNINTGTCAGRGTADSVVFNLSAPLAGGETSYNSGNVFHQFRYPGGYNLYAPAGAGRNVEVLVVGGGGGGGMDMGGGGGGGGVVYNAAYAISSGSSTSVQVGGGGAGAPAAGTLGQPTAHQYTISAISGQNSIFGTITAVGGGRGGSSHYPYTPGAAGAAGGSGGGASGYGDGTSRAGGAGTGGQGFAGGSGGPSQYYSGGGGGAAGVGASANNQANGGPGVLNTILGPSYYWGGGGGGAGYSICGGNGGIGGGGGGAVCTTTGGGSALYTGSPGGGGSTVSQTNRPGGDGGKNTGGGGGGGSHYNFNNKGGDGGSGIVIVKYPYTLYPINAGATSITMPVSPTGLAIGDEFLIINLQGNPANNNNVGQYEIHTISGINGNTISFTDYPLKNSYDVTTQRIVLQRIPNYTNVTIGRTASGNNGSSSGTAGYSCKDLRDSGVVADGNYWIDPDGAGGNAPFQAVCNMTRDGGGWTMVVKPWYLAGIMGNTGATGDLAAAVALKGTPFKFADTTIRQIIGDSQNFDVMGDQNGYNSAYSTGNFEYVILRNYTGYWRFDIAMGPSMTPTLFQSYRISDNYLASTFNLDCGEAGGAGINCYILLENNPGGGSYCDLNMGSAVNAGWHTFFMSQYNQDTYLYVCNGAQHSSSYNMNHRFWIRERKPAVMTASPWNGITGGIIAFRANGAVTIASNGGIIADGLGYRGGSGAGAAWNTARAFPGESYAGQGFRNITDWRMQDPNFGGGAGTSLSGGGPGGGYGSAGLSGVASASFHQTYQVKPGRSYGDPSLNKLFFGSGGGGGGDGYNGSAWGQSSAVHGEGGKGGGIILINAATLTLNNNSAVSSDGGSGSSGWLNPAVSWISGGSGGGGAGGSIKISAGSATTNNAIRANGGGSVNIYYGSYGATNGSYVINPTGGNGGSGRIAINYTTSLVGSTSPAATVNKIETPKIKIEGTDSINLKPSTNLDSVVGLWHFGENTIQKTYVYTGADQTYVVPAGVTSVNVKMWGGGGGSGDIGGWTYRFSGGGGGYTTGDIAVTPGQTLTVMVGGGGNSGNVANQSNIYGGGSRSCNTGTDCRYGGAGGGRSAIRFGGVDLLTAGGGGGGGASRQTISMHGGGGGGNTGSQGQSSNLANCWGNGGTQVAGGSGGVGTGANGQAGSQYTGGNPASHAYGGGGGGGWYGGGGGCYQEANWMGGGGGGSGYIGGAGVSNASTVGVGTYSRIPANNSDFDNGGAGSGGTGGASLNYGTPGKIIITPNSSVPATPYQEFDSSGNRLHGTLEGTTLTQGISGKARSFNGSSDNINLGSDNRFDFKKFSFEAWINPSSLAGCGAAGAPTCIIANKEYSYEWALDSSGNLYWAITPSWLWINTGLNFPANIWSHMAIVYDGQTVTSYINGGQAVTSVAKTGIPDKTPYPLRIGARGLVGAAMNFFAGKIDEVRFDNAPRSRDDIYQSYLKGSNQYISKTISSLDLSTKNTIPFYIAADRPGTYLQTLVGESAYANYQPDANTTALWHMEDDPQSFSDNFKGTSLSAGNWIEFDPNGNKISQNNGLILSAGTVAAWDSGIISTQWWTRKKGLTLYARFVTGASVANSMMIGFANNVTNVASYSNITHALYFNGGLLHIYQDGASIASSLGSYVANTAYEIKISLYDAGHAVYSIKGGTYTNWTVLYQTDTYKTNTPLRIQVANYQHTGTITNLTVIPQESFLTDSSFNKNHGILGGSTLVDGKMGKGHSFNGITDSVLINSNLNLANNSFTIETWAKRTTVGRSDFILGTTGYPNTNNMLHFGFRNTNVFMCDFYANGLDTADAYTDLNWHHWACTYDATTNQRRIYRDSIMVAQDTSSADMSGSGAVTIGRTDYNSNNADVYFNGLLDEVRISNIARTPEEIRQTYEAGIRSHPITIDFGAYIDNNDPITNSSDFNFIVDATIYGLAQKGSMLFKGDKVIVQQSIDNIVYLAQGTVTSITPSTGAVVVSSWDPGSTFPPLGFTDNARVFKWQREFWTLTEPLDSQLNATTNLTIGILGGAEDRTVWIDDLKTNTDYHSNPAGSTLTNSIDKRYVQYRAIISSFDEAVSATLSGVTVDYVPNYSPLIPSLDSPADSTISLPQIIDLKTTTTDIEQDFIRYKIELCTNLAMTANCQTFDQTLSQTGWSGQNTQGNTAYTSGTQATYTLQTPLSIGTTYFWRSYAIDPEGLNAWGNTQPTPFSFTTNDDPAIPTLDSPTASATGIPLFPSLKTTTTDADSDYLRYKIELCRDPGMSIGCFTFDQTLSQTGWSGQDAETGTAYASGTQATYTIQAPLTPNTLYFWRSSAIDPIGSNNFGLTQAIPRAFRTSIIPNTPILNAPANGSTGVTITPVFQTTGTDDDNDFLRYKIVMCLNLAMTLNCQTFDQTLSQTDWSGQNAETGTAYNSGSQASYSIEAPLLTNMTYFWRSSAIDPAGTNTFSATQSPPFSFTTIAAPADPSTCRVEKDRDNTQITIRWTDNSQVENGYQIWKVVDGGAPVHLTPDFEANTNSYTDTDITSGHTYGYLVRSFQYEGQNTLYSNWCPTATSSLFSGGFTIF